MNIAIKTLGCRSNRYESDELLISLLNAGHKVVEVNEGIKEFLEKHDIDLDILIVNTCTVTHVADRKSRQSIRSFKKEFPALEVYVFGCGTNVDKEGYQKIDEIDFIADDREMLLKKILNKSTGKSNEDAEKNDLNSCELAFEKFVNEADFRTRALLKIQDGCNNFCSYCIIPRARGPERSFNSEFLIDEAKKKEKLGFKELVITGINIGEWQENGKDISDLIEMLINATKDMQIRISSIEPKNFNDKFFELFKTGRLCPHMHMSLQSGSDGVLKRMKRHYDCAEYYDIAMKFKNLYPGMALTTDVIVGFPGETEQEFEETMEFVEKVGFAKIHVFPYSRRAQTAALYMDGHLDSATKKNRSHRLRALSDILSDKFKKSALNQTHRVLIESFSDFNLKGYTMNYIPVVIKHNENIVNTFVDVKLIKLLEDGAVLAEIVNKS